MSTQSGRRAVIAALLANLGIAGSKLVAFAITGSASMAAEAVHSLADSGNQGLLLLGSHRARREADEAHPFGYGRERYFAAFVVSLVIFSLGALFAIYEGIAKIRHPHHLDSPMVAVIVLGVAIVLEALSFRTAIRESSALRLPGQSWRSFIAHSKTPELPVVVLEDLGALVGLVLALAGVGLTTLTGDAVWDGLGTLSIGILLAVIAVVLSIETKGLLIGEAASAADVSAIRTALSEAEHVTRLIHLRTLHLGPDELLVAAKVALDTGLDVAGVARAIDAAEADVRACVPHRVVMYLEPDLDRTPL